jgi:N-acetylglucosamine kinase-like BadF-type ATPase
LLGKFPVRPTLLAVDGGASKIDVALVSRDGKVMAAARHRANANFGLDHDSPLGALEEAIRRACAKGGFDSEVRPVAEVGLFCLAGADLPLDDRRIARQLKSREWTRTVAVWNDTFAVLRAGTERGWGVAVVAGSGLNCAGVGPDGRNVRFPSFGELSGDRAHGGGWLGRAALGAAIRARDRRGPRTVLETIVPDHFGMARPATVMEAVYVGELDPDRMLELAPLVFRAARQGDAVARELIDQVADEVVATAGAAIRRLGVTGQDVHVILGGGLFRSGDGRLIGRIRDGIKSVAPAAEIRKLQTPPVVGAALLGLDALRARPRALMRVREQLTERLLK